MAVRELVDPEVVDARLVVDERVELVVELVVAVVV